jgi:sugar phosphate isomerase/epimerase
MYLTGFADEAANDIDGQIRAIKALGWTNIESRAIDGVNLTLIDDAKFETVCEKLAAAGIAVNCFGSGVANWAKKISDPPDSSYDELRRAIPRMRRLHTTMIRVMSFAMPQDASSNDPGVEKEVIARMRTLVRMAEDGGVTIVHENCDGWGGLSWEHTLRLLDAMASPNFALVFDTGNPVFHYDVRGSGPYSRQDAWEFYSHVKDHIAYIHVKDGRMERDTMRYTFPGEGDAQVSRILADLKKRGYNGGFSIEPHMAAVAHDPAKKSEATVRFENFAEYGRRAEKLLREAGYSL